MSMSILMQLSTQLLWLVVLISMPVVLAVAVVSLIVGLFQTLTQLQDQSLQFICKLATVSITLFVFCHWMSIALLNFSNMAFQQISAMGL